MDNLRLILLLLGLIILAAIILFHKPRGQSLPNHARWLQRRREPSLGAKADDESDNSSDREQDDEANPAARQSSFPNFSAIDDDKVGSARGQSPSATPAPAETAVKMDERRQPDKIVSLFVRRRDERRINGSELLDAAVKAGLTFGEMNIFHRLHEGDERPVFSMANLTPPGHFDASSWNVFDTPGMALFATLPGPVSALDAWDAMLATGRRIAELLDAELLDDAKCLLTRQRIAQIREEMREYDRQHGLGGGN